MKIILTGRPGVGKTTVVSKVVQGLRETGIKVGGMMSYEAREGGVRTGFVIEDLKTGLRGIMASVNHTSGPRVGKYGVKVGEIERVGVKAIENALLTEEVVVIDEVGPMELFSKAFKYIVVKAFSSDKGVLATVHYRTFTNHFERRTLSLEGKVFTVTVGNRDLLPRIVLEELLQ